MAFDGIIQAAVKSARLWIMDGVIALPNCMTFYVTASHTAKQYLGKYVRETGKGLLRRSCGRAVGCFHLSLERNLLVKLKVYIEPYVGL